MKPITIKTIKYATALVIVTALLTIINGNTNELMAQNSYGQVNITTSPQIDILMDVRRNANSKSSTISGFRVQIIQDTKRDLVREQKTELLQYFPNIRAYETYNAPFYKLRLGDFKDRYDAYRVYKEVKKNFKRAFIVPAQVNLSEL